MDSKNIKSVLKTQAKVVAYVVICLTVIVIGISYSLYSDVKHNQKNQVITSGTLQFSYSNGTKITETNETCFNQTNDTDAQALTGCSYDITITNTGTLPSAYTLTLKSTATGNALELSKLKVILKKAGSLVNGYPKTISQNNLALATEKIQAGGSVKYTIQVFVDENAVTEADNEKTISFEVLGSAEVSADNNINPTK